MFKTNYFDYILPVGAVSLIGIFIWRVYKLEQLKALVKKFEGERLAAYKDEAGKWTIGIGHLIKPNEQHLIEATITPEQSAALFKNDISIALNAITEHVKVGITPEMKAALASLIFNIGTGNFQKSTLLKKLNLGDYQGAAQEFMKWVNAGGQKSAGLEKRRMAEMVLFQTKVG